MDALPSSANLLSYVVVTILLCMITYILILNLPYLGHAMSLGRDKTFRVLRKVHEAYRKEALPDSSSEALPDRSSGALSDSSSMA